MQSDGSSFIVRKESVAEYQSEAFLKTFSAPNKRVQIIQ